MDELRSILEVADNDNTVIHGGFQASVSRRRKQAKGKRDSESFYIAAKQTDN